MRTGVGFVDGPEDEIFNMAQDATAEVIMTEARVRTLGITYSMGRTASCEYQNAEVAIQKRGTENEEGYTVGYDLVRKEPGSDKYDVLATVTQDRELKWPSVENGTNPLMENMERTLWLFRRIKDQAG